jgi:hypothetical protein
MAHSSPWRGLLRSAFALSALSVACGDPQPQKPLPPVVTLDVPEPNTIGTSLKMRADITGCDSVESLTLLNQGVPFKQLPIGGGEEQMALKKNEVPYKDGIAARLTLSVRGRCSDGRESESQPVSATFFPVAMVVEPSDGTQVVTDYFVAEGSGDTVSFIGCGNASTGLGTLYRVDVHGRVIAELPMPFVCTAETSISERHFATGTRWVWTPDAGVMAIKVSSTTSAMEMTAAPTPQLRLTSLTMDPDGNAIARNTAGEFVRLNRAPPSGGSLLMWQSAYQVLDTPIGQPVFRSDLGTLLLPMYGRDPSDTAEGAVSIHVLNYKNGPTVDGAPLSSHIVKYLYGVDPTPPAAAFDLRGDSLYLSFLAANNQTLVVSCKTNGTVDAKGDMPCEGGNLLWQSQPLQGDVLALISYASGSRLAAVAAQHAWFLDPSRQGTVLNKGGQALTPNGALVVRQIQQGYTGSINGGKEFYLLNGAPSSLQTTELIGVDTAEQGEVFRHLQAGGDFSMALDASGVAWMRVNKNLVKLMPLGEYRAALPAN